MDESKRSTIRKAMRRLGRGLTNSGLICLGCALALLILELGLRWFRRPELSSWRPNLDIVFPLDPEVTTGVAGPAHIKTNSRGLRGTEWSNDRAGEYRILAIGGSTTECLAQDQPNTWPALLQTRLPTAPDGRVVWVGNAGHGGQNSRHHVLAMRYWPELYDPDAIVILMGGNDPMRALNEAPAYDTGFIDNRGKMRGLAQDFSERPASLEGPGGLSYRSLSLWAFIKDFRNRFSGRSPGFVQSVTQYREMQKKRRRASQFVDRMPDLKPGLDGYRRNIREIIRLARERNIPLVLMTQPSLLKPAMPEEEVRRLWSGWTRDPSLNVYWSTRVWAESMDAHNRALREVCRESGVDCLDLASKLPKTAAVTWDQAHFTDLGSRLVADELAACFRASFPKIRKSRE
jgi:hypothetical protein